MFGPRREARRRGEGPLRRSYLAEGLGELVRIRPGPGSWAAALQASVAVAVPPAAFTLGGQQRLGLLASFGSLIVLYLSDRSRRERAAKLPVIGLGFLVGAVTGILTGATLLGNLFAISVIAITFSFISLSFKAGPPGAIFPVLLAGTTGQLTAPTSAGGVGLEPAQVLGMVAVGLTWGYTVEVAPLAFSSVRRRDRKHDADLRWHFGLPDEAGEIFSRLFIAVVVSSATSYALGLHHIAWVLLSVIGILQKDADIHLGAIRTAQRLLGTGLGIGMATVFQPALPQGPALIVTVGVLVFGFVAILRRNLMFALMFVTLMALLLAAGGTETQLRPSADNRLIDTMVGGAVAATVLGAVATTRHLFANCRDRHAGG